VAREPRAREAFEPRSARHEAAAYVIEGEATLASAPFPLGQLACGTERNAHAPSPIAARSRCRYDPGRRAGLRGPLVFHGPFVMNTTEQVRAAEIAYRTGRMGELA
jgi:redox-sensitive bicupin YhaK (pirin superfamily)